MTEHSDAPGAPTVAELARLIGARVHGDPHRLVRRIAPLASDESDALGCVGPADTVRDCRVGSVLVRNALDDVAATQLVADDLTLALARIAATLRTRCAEPTVEAVHPSAVVDPTAVLEAGVSIGAGAVIEGGARIGSGTVVGPSAVVGSGAWIGHGCVVHAGVVLYAGAVLGNGVVVQPGAVIGADGFGYVWTGASREKLPQIGDVRVADEVEIGSLCTVDRAALGSTRIGNGTHLGPLSHVAHNCAIGRDCSIGPFSAIAGSTTTGDRIEFEHHVILYDHLRIADDVRFKMNSIALASVTESGDYAGHPLQPADRWARTQAALTELPELARAMRRQ